MCVFVNIKVQWHFCKVQLNLFYIHWFERHNIGKLQQNLQMCYLQNCRIVLWAKSTMRSNSRWLLQKRKKQVCTVFYRSSPYVILPISPINAIDNIEPVFVNNKMSRLTNPMTFETTKQVLHKIDQKTMPLKYRAC